MKNRRNQKKLDSLLIRESENGHTEAVKLLLEAGANVHVLEDLALRMTSAAGHTETVKALLDAGALAECADDGF